jgi:hypothetical protein
MALPTNGRVVIVDDEIEKEALPLIQALSKRGIPVRFFNGRASTLPDRPVGKVRLLFLDLKLEGMDFSQDPENTAQALKGVVEKIIGPENGPYIIFGWTKTPSHLAAVVKKLSNRPVLVLDMEKSSCIVDETCDLTKIEKKFKKKLAEIGTYRLLFKWENLVNDSATNIVNEICRATSTIMSLETILYKVAEANWGEDNVAKVNGSQRTKAALQVFDSLLNDSIDSRVNSSRFLGLKRPADGNTLDLDFVSKFNSRLLLSQRTDKKPAPGSVYIEFNRKRKKASEVFSQERININIIRKHVTPEVERQHKKTFSQLPRTDRDNLINVAAEKFFKNILKESKIIFVEITPVCDYAQAQAKHHRIIPGFFLKNEYEKFLNKSQHDISFYISVPVYIDSFAGPYLLLFDLRGFQTIDIDSLKDKKPLLRLRQEMLFDMQHKAGSHFSRPGIVSLRK